MSASPDAVQSLAANVGRRVKLSSMPLNVTTIRRLQKISFLVLTAWSCQHEAQALQINDNQSADSQSLLPNDDNGNAKSSLHFAWAAESGTYSDQLVNSTAAQQLGPKNVATRGQRYILERYPAVKQPSGDDDGGWYLLGELRNSRTRVPYWQKRQVALGLIGKPLLATDLGFIPIFGLYWEFNGIQLDHAETPDVVRVQIRAYALGLNLRQQHEILQNGLGFFYRLRFYSLNPGIKDTGFEVGATLGLTSSLSFLNAEMGIEYLENRFTSMEASAVQDSTVLLRSRYRSLSLMASLCF